MALEGAAIRPAADEESRALIASACLAGTSTRRVKRALYGLFEGAARKEVVSRAGRKGSARWA